MYTKPHSMKTSSPIHAKRVQTHNYYTEHCRCSCCVMVHTAAAPTLLAWCRGVHLDSRYRLQRHSPVSSIPEEYEAKIISWYRVRGYDGGGGGGGGRASCFILFEYRMTKYGIGRVAGIGTQTHSLAQVVSLVSLLLCTSVSTHCCHSLIPRPSVRSTEGLRMELVSSRP